MAVDGNWNIVMSTPMGDRNTTLSLKNAGGTLTGSQTAEGGHGTEYGLPTTAYHLVDTPEEVPAALAALARQNPDVVKIMYDHLGWPIGSPDVQDGQIGALGVAMRKDVMQAIVAQANAMGLKVQVHTGTWNDALAAIEAGAPYIAHLGAVPIPDDVVAAAVSHGVYWAPTLSLYHGLFDIMNDQSLLEDPLLARVSTQDVIQSYENANIWLDADTDAWLSSQGSATEPVSSTSTPATISGCGIWG